MATDSDDYLSEDRKRKGNHPVSPFKKSKKIMRTPSKQAVYTDEEDDIGGILKQVLAEVKSIRRENKEFREEIEKLQRTNSRLENELQETKQRLNYVEDRLENYEKEKKRNNIVITGMKIDTTDTAIMKQKITKFIKQNLDEEIHIENAIKLSQNACLVQMKDNVEKSRVMEKKHKLKFIREERIYINHDLSINERKIQKEIREKGKELRKEGKTVKIGLNKLTVDGSIWKWDRNNRDIREQRENILSKNGK